MLKVDVVFLVLKSLVPHRCVTCSERVKDLRTANAI